MSKHSHIDSFSKERALSYEQSNQHLEPINKNLHYLIQIILSDLKPKSKILCVGAGTGSEIIALAESFLEFQFVVLEPSKDMLEVCKKRLQKLNLLSRCEFIQGYVHDLGDHRDFDAAICLLVFHHTSKDGKERTQIIQEVHSRLKPEGYFITSELSYDFNTETKNDLMKQWQSLSKKSGSSDEKIKLLPQMMKDHLSLMSSEEVEDLLKNNGFKHPTQFFQSLIIKAWYTQKNN